MMHTVHHSRFERGGTVINPATTIFRGLAKILLVKTIGFAQVMAAAIGVISGFKYVHDMTLIKRKHSQLRTIAPRSAESPFVSGMIRGTRTSIVIVITLPFMEVTALIR